MEDTLKKYCKSLLGATYDFQEEWNAVRFHVGGKIFAMLSTNEKGQKYITLKCNPAKSEELQETYKDIIIPGYYMNKTHWITVYYEADLSVEFLQHLIVGSYQLIFDKLTKKLQNEIMKNNEISK
ncbi:MmcQ/YjbR family DNA-binding protein [Paenibacillus alvei]|uniref:MmcQ/YjbR family DNA-binding protein n=1 Tax=Niallia sp. FSL R7-0271 TaxID=2921678 RepID=UPI0030F8CD8D